MVLCDICHEKPARIFYSETINGVRKEQHLCEECAAEHTIFSLKDRLGNEIPIGNILTGILNNYTKNLKADESSEISCTNCGMTMSEVIKTGKLGCPSCYNRFASFLNKNLKTVHGADSHRGKEPLNAVKLPYAPEPDPVPSNEPEIDLEDIIGPAAPATPAAPVTGETLDAKIENLKKAMALAAEEEDYLKAAEYRDMLHAALERKRTETERDKKKPSARKKPAQKEKPAAQKKKPSAKNIKET